jgi:hemerythrin
LGSLRRLEMALIWDESSFGTGVPEIDKQHKKLFEQINRLLEVSVLGGQEDEVKSVLEFIEFYILDHFEFEECLMDKCNARCRFENKKGHEYFKKEFAKLKEVFQKNGATPDFVTDAQMLLVRWFGNHVIKVDTGLKENPAAKE